MVCFMASRSFLKGALLLLICTQRSYSFEQDRAKHDQNRSSSSSSSVLSSSKSTTLPPTYQVPSFTINEIQSGKKDNDLKDILTTTGLLAIRIPVPDHHDHQKQHLLEGLCKCQPQDIAQIANGDSRTLADGLTTRSTIASASRGQLPISLPQSDITKYCGEGVYESLEKLRDYVSLAATDTFIPALDRLIQQTNSNHVPTLEVEEEENPSKHQQQQHLIKTRYDEKEYHTISSIIEDANHLEHFHVYSKAKHDTSTSHHKRPTSTVAAVDSALDWHTDGGLFLAFVPGKSCTDNRDVEDDSFHVSIPSEKGNQHSRIEMRAIFPQSINGEIVVAIMLGAGAEHWLNTPDNLKLRATQHAVKMKGGDVRAWYGMMHLVPSQAIIQETPIPRTFAEMKKSSVHSISRKFGDDDSLQESDIVIGCGNDDDDVDASGNNNNSMQGITSSRRHNRRLQHVGGQEDCDGSSNYFCWLSCLKKPKSDHSADHHLMKGDSLYCYDPSILDTTGDLELAVKECTDPISGKAGGVMNEACANYWHPTVDGVKSYLESDDQYSQSDKKKYCYGATAMYMQGFEWEGTTCVVFLFTSWVISTRFALVVACIGTILLGILTEFITYHRRSILKKVEERRKKVLASGALYAGQVTIGYAIMLVVMTYSGPLVISVILGLGLGHIITNWKEKKPGYNVDKSGGNVDNVNKSDDIVIEGITPCCQYLDDDKDHDSHDISRDVHITESDRSEP